MKACGIVVNVWVPRPGVDRFTWLLAIFVVYGIEGWWSDNKALLLRLDIWMIRHSAIGSEQRRNPSRLCRLECDFACRRTKTSQKEIRGQTVSCILNFENIGPGERGTNTDPMAAFTAYAVKYGLNPHLPPGSGKSGLTPIAPSFYDAPTAVQSVNDINEKYQRRVLTGYTLQHLQELDCLTNRQLKPTDLSNEIWPISGKANGREKPPCSDLYTI